MQPVSQFDEDDPHIPRHGKQHFTKIFRLCVLFRFEFYFVELADTIYQFSNGLAEFLADFFFGSKRIFYNIMQQCGYQSLGVELPFSQNG